MNQTSALIILVAAILTNNILLTNFLGMCSFIACSGQIATAVGLGTAVTFVMTITTMLNFVIYHFVLLPLGLDHLTFIVFNLMRYEVPDSLESFYDILAYECSRSFRERLVSLDAKTKFDSILF